jgi:hypothetical protein
MQTHGHVTHHMPPITGLRLGYKHRQSHLHLLPAALILLQARLCRRQSAAWQAALQ